MGQPSGGDGDDGAADGSPGADGVPRDHGSPAIDGSPGVGGRLAGALVPGVVRRHYATKFLLAALVVVLLIAAVGGLSYVQIRDVIEEDAESALRSSATLQADSVAEWIAGKATQTGAVASSDVLTSGNANRIGAYLDSAHALASSDVVGIHVVDRESERIVASTNDRYAAQPVHSRSPAWRDAIADAHGGGVGSSETTFERRGRVLMAFATATPDGGAWVVVVGDAGEDIEQLHETGVAERTRVLDADGLDVFEPRGNTPSDVADDPAFRAALDGETGISVGESEVHAFAPVAGEEWVVVTEASKAVLYAASRTVGQYVLVLVATSVVALAVVGFVLGRESEDSPD